MLAGRDQIGGEKYFAGTAYLIGRQPGQVAERSD
jgi:hypothetical protein